MFLYVEFRRRIYDEYNDEEVELTKDEVKLVKRLLKGKAPHTDFDPYAVRALELPFCTGVSRRDTCSYLYLTRTIILSLCSAALC